MDAGLKVVEMLTSDSHEVAYRIAQELDGHNRERQATEAKVLEEAIAEVEGNNLRDRRSIVVGKEGWHPGVLGIVASRIVERFHRPTVVVGFHQGEGKGSARSIRGFHIVEAFQRCADLLEKFGGHEYAGGLSVRQDRFPLFVDRFEEIARSSLTPDDLVPLLEVDAEMDFSRIDFSVVREIAALQPFGIGNPEPLFMTRGVEISERKEFNGGARFRFRHADRSLSGVGFGAEFRVTSSESGGKEPSKLETQNAKLTPGAKIDLVYRLSENEWNGAVTVELRIVDVRVSGWVPVVLGQPLV
jgi:single-stranded-DNA-specific exonuclease